MGTRDDTTTDHTADAAGQELRSVASGSVSALRTGEFPRPAPVPEPDSLLEPIEAEVVPLPTDERPHRGSAGGPVPFADQVPATEQVCPVGYPGETTPRLRRRRTYRRGPARTIPPPDTPVQAASTPVGSAPPPQSMGPRYRAVQRRVSGRHRATACAAECSAVSGRVRADDSHPLSLPGRLRPLRDATRPNWTQSSNLLYYKEIPRPLDDGTLVKRERQAPRKGWRRAVYKATGGTINPRNPRSEVYREKLVSAIRTPLAGDYRIAVLTQGWRRKTTTAIALGSTLASLRGDRVIAVDANPDLGTLAQRLPRETDSTVRDLLADRNLNRFSDIREHTSQAPSRLEVLASERDPAAAEAFNDEEYRGVLGILQRFYNIIITDCGTGLSNSVMKGVLDTADSIIVVSSPPSTAHAARHRPSIGSTRTASVGWCRRRSS